MKKNFFIIFVTTFLLVMSSTFSVFTVSADTVDKAEECFMSAINAEDIALSSYDRDPLYDEDLTQNGWQYNFNANNQNGYALLAKVIVNNVEMYEIEEIKFNAVSPFADCDGLPIYVTRYRYIDYNNEAFTDLASGEALTEEEVENLSTIGFGYDGVSSFYDSVETINYATKSTTLNYSIPYGLPPYHGVVGGSSCAAVAGAVSIGYYDRFNENLIPNFQVYRTMGSYLIYKTGGTEVDSLITSLYSLMSTNAGQVGTTFTGFHIGMNSYVNSRNATYTYSDMFTLGSLDFAKFKASIDEGKPVALFLSRYALVKSSVIGDSQETLTYMCSDVAHVAMAFGYKVEEYYDTNGAVIDTRYYLNITVGLDNVVGDSGYLNVNGITILDHASKIVI